MKALLGIVVLLVVAALVGAAYYLKLSLDLPELSTENQVVDLVGRSVEAYRAEQAHDSGGTTARFAVTAREVLKSPVGRALLVLERCPDYLAAPPPPELDFWRA